MQSSESSNERPSQAHRRRTQASRREETQARILDAALRVIRTQGVQGATFTEIAREAGVTAGALQHHYGSKDILLTKIIDLVFEERKAGGSIWPSREMPVRDRASSFVEHAWQAIYGNERYLASWHLHFGCHTSPALADRLNEMRGDWVREMTSCFLESFPELNSSENAEGFAKFVFSSLRGIGMLAWFGDPPDKNSDQLKALVDAIVRACTDSHASRRKQTVAVNRTGARRRDRT
ncbi:TetR/AcrR family transcriptional regulator [Paraburkholderia phymatum]|uniref:TetR/AcrR family transcriptional regulator n=1 Tax=Paraburkholderia phymatum TaxID=148447 RepID=A0ACC6U449_9BURK